MANENTPSANIHNSPKNVWTTRQREVLCVLFKFYSTPISESVQVFNALFDKELRKCGFTNGIPHLSLNSQWHSLYVGGAAVFERVQIETLLSDETDRWKDMREEIEETAKNIGLTLVKRKFEQFRDVSKFGSKQHVYKSLSSEAGYYPDDTELEELALQPTPSSNAPTPSLPLVTRNVQQRHDQRVRKRYNPNPRTPSQRSQAVTYNVTPTSAGSQEPSQIETPTILYRYWGEQSQGYNSRKRFAAGLFCDNPDSIPNISSYGQEEIDEMTVRHLTRMEIPSPYISTSGTLFSPLHRALHHEETAAVTVIDVSKIDSSTLFSAQKIIREKRTDFAANYASRGLGRWTYRGENEWLIWGDIPEDSIICRFTMDTVLRIAKNFSDIEATLQLSVLRRNDSSGGSKKDLRSHSVKINETTGKTIGRFLRLINLPMDYVENVSTNILKAWGFEGVKWDGRGLDENRYENFLRGVRNGHDTAEAAPKQEDVEVEYITIDSTDESDQEETPSSYITTLDSSPLDRISGERIGGELRVTVPAGQSDRPSSTLAGLKREMKEEEEFDKAMSLKPIQWVDVDIGGASGQAVAKPRTHIMDASDFIAIQGSDDDEEGVPAPGDVVVDRFAAKRNRINCLLNL